MKRKHPKKKEVSDIIDSLLEAQYNLIDIVVYGKDRGMNGQLIKLRAKEYKETIVKRIDSLIAQIG